MEKKIESRNFLPFKQPTTPYNTHKMSLADKVFLAKMKLMKLSDEEIASKMDQRLKAQEEERKKKEQDKEALRPEFEKVWAALQENDKFKADLDKWIEKKQELTAHQARMNELDEEDEEEGQVYYWLDKQGWVMKCDVEGWASALEVHVIEVLEEKEIEYEAKNVKELVAEALEDIE